MRWLQRCRFTRRIIRCITRLAADEITPATNLSQSVSAATCWTELRHFEQNVLRLRMCNFTVTWLNTTINRLSSARWLSSICFTNGASFPTYFFSCSTTHRSPLIFYVHGWTLRFSLIISRFYLADCNIRLYSAGGKFALHAYLQLSILFSPPKLPAAKAEKTGFVRLNKSSANLLCRIVKRVT